MDEYHELDPATFASASTLYNMLMFFDYIGFACSSSTKSPGLQTLLDYPKDFRFDLILFDNTNSNCLLPLIQRFNYPPTISVTAFLLPYYFSLTFGNSLHPSYLPFFGVKYTPDMDFFQRVTNYFWTNLDWFLRNVYINPMVEDIARRRFGDEMAPLSSLEEHISLLFCNLDQLYHYPQPLTPNIIPVGGMHIRPPKRLPKDIKKIADNAMDGLILLSLGTNIRSDELGPTKIKAILDAFARLNQSVLWKFESKLTQFTVPKNVHIREWLPQNDLLAHPNMKLFISHGGALSTIEAAYHAVPVIGIPFIVDQYLNILMIEDKKLGIQLRYEDITSDKLLSTINEILKNSSYAERMLQMSRRLKDQLQTPLDRAVFWAEYAIRYNGTHVLDTKSRSLSRFVSTSTDVQLFLFLVFGCVLYLCIKACHIVISKQKNKFVKTKMH